MSNTIIGEILEWYQTLPKGDKDELIRAGHAYNAHISRYIDDGYDLTTKETNIVALWGTAVLTNVFESIELNRIGFIAKTSGHEQKKCALITLAHYAWGIPLCTNITSMMFNERVDVNPLYQYFKSVKDIRQYLAEDEQLNDFIQQVKRPDGRKIQVPS